MNWFRRTAIAQKLRDELYGAEIDLIDAHKKAEQWKAQAECARRLAEHLRAEVARVERETK